MLTRRKFIGTTLVAGAALTTSAQQARPQPASKRTIVDAQVHFWKANSPDWPWDPGAKPQLPEPFTIERALGLFNTWPGLIIPYVAFGLPLGIYTLSAFFREIPWELEKAAKVDGASPFQAFVKVIAPLAAPGMVTTAILVFLACWNDFLLAISFTSTISARTAPAAMQYFSGGSVFTIPTGPIAAAAVVITIPIIIFVLFFQRRIVAGLTSGAVKG